MTILLKQLADLIITSPCAAFPSKLNSHKTASYMYQCAYLISTSGDELFNKAMANIGLIAQW